MRGVIKKWGNSAAVRLPAPALKSLRLNVEDNVEIRLENGCIILQPIQSCDYSLGELLSRITPDNLHPEIDFGTPAY
ncbi:MAG TPA: AbrB/MazE/SpoVT family DNA-binding domain-containing protein [Burkholderiaceae bacterium]|nr:AbrB/MazE/SpoVT family DNA-binding domain-containing protein [Burkholderiaceae bacterium]